MKRINTVIIFITASLLSFSCGGKKTEENTAAEEHLIEITPEQYKTSGMELGKLSVRTFQDEVVCKGYIFAPANSIAKISTPIAGTLNSIRFKIGDYVSAGQVVATISGSEFLGLQQSFAEASAAYSKAKLDYERVKALRAEKIGAEKDFIAVESAFKSSSASYNSLKTRINALKLSASQIENGQMYTSFPVTAPIGGYITKTSAVIGQYIDLQNEVAEIVNVNGLQLQLAVYDTDVRKLSAGQTVRFGTSANPNRSLTGTLINIGKTINPDTKSIDCIASINKSNNEKLVNQSFVEAVITVSEKEAKALSVQSVQKQGNEYFIYVVDKKSGENYMLKKVPVTVGKMDKDNIEITSEIPDKDVIIKGIETLQ